MKNPAGEMPFLDHLEELRSRIIYSLLALVVCVGLGIWLVLRFNVITVLQEPALKYFPQGLTTLSLTEPWGIFLTVSLILGVVLASPVILYQLWAFLSPALMPKEKRAIIPTLYFGLVLFLLGAWVSWHWMLPFTIQVLKDPPAGSFNMIVTWDSYFDLVIILVVAIGIMTELPLVMIILTWIGIVPARVFRKGRRVAIVVNMIIGAIISPGSAIPPMIVCTVPLIALYEVGVLGSWLVERRARKRSQAAIAGLLLLMLLGGAPLTLRAQIPPPATRPLTAQDTTHRKPITSTGTDSARNKRLGLPQGQSIPYPPPDSMGAALLARPGYRRTQYVGDSAFISASDERMRLLGHSSVRFDGRVVEGNQLTFDNRLCEMLSVGETRVFDPERSPAISSGLRVDTCKNRSVLPNAATRSTEIGGGDWFLRGNLAVDSSGHRLYMEGGEFTTCDLEIADYHFASKQLKWISQSVLVGRPAVLYVRDVPVMWLPFLFQDTKGGRHSGILIPKFGVNDIVRPARSYNRQVTDFGYYWATNDYMDVTTRMNWYANRYFQVVGLLNYDVVNWFMKGSIEYGRMFEYAGSGNADIRMTHHQDFNANTRLDLNIDYSSNPGAVQRNSVDPYQSTQQVSSSLNFTKRYAWGNISLGGTRSQELTTGAGSMTLPSFSISPAPIAFGTSLTWSPSLSLTNASQFNTVLVPQLVISNGVVDTLHATGSSRNTSLTLQTPLRIGRFNLPLILTAADQTSDARTQSTQRLPDPANPADSVTRITTQNGDYLSTLNWETSIELPRLFQQTWNIVPSMGITNIYSGPYMLRSASSNGKWVQQGKRLQFGVTTSPSVYSFLNIGLGPAMRFRHTFSPNLQVQYSPSATLPLAYATAYSAKYGTAVPTETPPRLQATVSLSQTLMAKLRPPKGDTTTNEANFKRVTLLSINTSGVAYDFEQAKLPGRTGWSTQGISNQLQSDLLPGFSLSLAHDLWQGAVGSDTAVFKPFLTSMQAGFQLSGNTFRSLAALVGLSSARSGTGAAAPGVMVPAGGINPAQSNRPGSSFTGMGAGGSGFTANVSYSLSRTRPNAPAVIPIDPNTGLPGTLPFTPQIPDQTNISLNSSFSPTHLWRVSWQTMYNVTAGRFESHSLQLTRDLHDWRAIFNFQKTPSGNFTLNFSIVLRGMEQNIKFDYNQTTIRTNGP